MTAFHLLEKIAASADAARTPRAETELHPLGQNAALFAALNRRRRADRAGWIIAASALAVLMAMAVL